MRSILILIFVGLEDDNELFGTSGEKIIEGERRGPEFLDNDVFTLFNKGGKWVIAA